MERSRGALVVGGEALRLVHWLDFRDVHGAWCGVHRAVDEEDECGVGDVLREVRCPLLAGENADGGVSGEAFFGPVSEPGADAVVGSKGVAAGENEAGHGSMAMHFQEIRGSMQFPNRRSFDAPPLR